MLLETKLIKVLIRLFVYSKQKRENFDTFYIRKFCPRNFDKFEFSPSIVASGGLLTAWNNSFFDGTIVQTNSYAITVNFCCIIKASIWPPQVPLKSLTSSLGY